MKSVCGGLIYSVIRLTYYHNLTIKTGAKRQAAVLITPVIHADTDIPYEHAE